MLEKIEYIIFGVILFSNGFSELNRGRKILMDNEISFNLAVRIRFKLIEFVSGTEAKQAYMNNLIKSRNWRLWGIMGVIYGLFAMLLGGILLILGLG